MSTVASDNSFIIESEIQDLSDIKEEIISEDIICKTEPVDTEKVLNISFEKRKLSEIISVSSSTSSFDSCSDSDTDNNSDLDEEEYNNELKICDEKLREIESGFELLKTILYKERIRKVEEKLVEVRLGTAKEYEIPLQTLKDQMDSRLEVASLLRQFKLVNLKHKYEAEEQAIRQNFENNKEILYDTIKADLEEKIQQLEEARNEVDIDASLWLGRSLRCSGRGRGRHPYRQVQPKRKPVIISGGPCIVYMLKEHEILEDWTAIKKMLSSSKRRENADQRYKSY